MECRAAGVINTVVLGVGILNMECRAAGVINTVF
jgi:hypothetical protein